MYTIGTIACCIGNSETSNSAVQYGAALAFQFNADLVLLQSVFPDFVAPLGANCIHALQLGMTIDCARRRAPGNVVVRSGIPGQVGEADIVLFNDDRFHEITRFDSPICEAAERNIPLLCVPERMSFTKPRVILCAVDANRKNNHAILDIAVSLACSFQAKLYFLELPSEAPAGKDSCGGLSEIRALLTSEFENSYCEVSFAQNGDPGEEMLRILSERRVDLAIVPLHLEQAGRERDLAARGTCPILFVTPRSDDC